MRNIWDDGEGFFEPVSEHKIKEAEDYLKVKLPDSYIDLIKIKNGGKIKYPAFPTNEPNSWTDNWVPFYKLAGIDNDPHGINTIFMTPYMADEWDLPSNIVLLYGEGHYWIALDYRNCGPEGEPSICWLNVDAEQDFTLANSFDEFVNGLISKDEIK